MDKKTVISALLIVFSAVVGYCASSFGKSQEEKADDHERIAVLETKMDIFSKKLSEVGGDVKKLLVASNIDTTKNDTQKPEINRYNTDNRVSVIDYFTFTDN